MDIQTENRDFVGPSVRWESKILMKRLLLKMFKIILKNGKKSLLLTFIFHEGLSFMALGFKPMCISMLAIATGGSYAVL